MKRKLVLQTELIVKESAEQNAEQITEKGKERFLQNNAGVGVVEIILILVVLIALVLIFKDQLTAIVEKAMSALEKSVDRILK